MLAITDMIDNASFDPKLARLEVNELFRKRPDAMRVRWDGTNYVIDAHEYGSDGQTKAQLEAKLIQQFNAVKQELASRGINNVRSGELLGFEKDTY